MRPSSVHLAAHFPRRAGIPPRPRPLPRPRADCARVGASAGGATFEGQLGRVEAACVGRVAPKLGRLGPRVEAEVEGRLSALDGRLAAVASLPPLGHGRGGALARRTSDVWVLPALILLLAMLLAVAARYPGTLRRCSCAGGGAEGA